MESRTVNLKAFNRIVATCVESDMAGCKKGVNDILRLCCAAAGLERHAALSASKIADLSMLRAVASVAALTVTDKSYTQVGRVLNLHHTTVIYYMKQYALAAGWQFGVNSFRVYLRAEYVSACLRYDWRPLGGYISDGGADSDSVLEAQAKRHHCLKATLFMSELLTQGYGCEDIAVKLDMPFDYVRERMFGAFKPLRGFAQAK